MTPTETSELQQERDGVIRSSAWLGRVEQLKADIIKLQAFIETLTPEERTGPLRTVNQVRAHAWGIALQMEAVVLQAERPNE
jgi:hypothetical protein